MTTRHAPEPGADSEAMRRHAAHPAAALGAGPAEDPILDLQRLIGNRQVSRMIATGQSHRLPAQRDHLPDGDAGPVQATPEVGMEGGPVSDDLAGRIQGQRGGGAALDAGTRATMEHNVGASFGDVRVHTGGEAAALNRSISARAFTTGSDIFLGAEASPSDTGILAHELTHVVQQRGMSASELLTVGPAGDSYEQAADASAAAVTSQAAAPLSVRFTSDRAGR